MFIKGYKQTESHKRKLKEAKRGDKHWAFGKHFSEQHKSKMREAIKKRKQRNGYVVSLEAREKIKNKLLGHSVSNETKEKMRKNYKYHAPRKGIKTSPETKLKQRLAHIRLISRNYGISHPNYNPKACEYFKQFDIDNNTTGEYAMYGGGEHYIKELGYWVDYFNQSLKLIIEYDEKYHYDKNGNLKAKDVFRQQEIQLMYPDFEFRRICD